MVIFHPYPSLNKRQRRMRFWLTYRESRLNLGLW